VAKSIRVSDGIYELAAKAGDLVNRSLAEQLEYWVRLGSVLDASGITMEQVSRLLDGDPRLKEELIAHVASARRRVRRRDHAGAPSIAARSARFDSEVSRGMRIPESLLILSRERVKSAQVIFAAEEARGAVSW
jgi:hypothetical protein